MPEPKHPFDYHKPSEKQMEQIAKFRQGIKDLHQLILDTIPDGRERAVTITQLQTVGFWGNHAIIMAKEGEVQ